MQTPPETTTALLMNPEKRRTWHTYVRSERVAYITADRTVGGLGTAHIFVCSETGAERRYGMDA